MNKILNHKKLLVSLLIFVVLISNVVVFAFAAGTCPTCGVTKSVQKTTSNSYTEYRTSVYSGTGCYYCTSGTIITNVYEQRTRYEDGYVEYCPSHGFPSYYTVISYSSWTSTGASVRCNSCGHVYQ